MRGDLGGDSPRALVAGTTPFNINSPGQAQTTGSGFVAVNTATYSGYTKANEL
jgi:hypothetical protein